MAANLRVLLAEDHFLARFAVKKLLGEEPGFEIVGEAETGWQAVELFRRLTPDVVVMDMRMPDLDGLGAITSILHDTPGARILVLSHYDGADDLDRALAAGALGYLKKDADGATLIAAVRAVASGNRFVPEAASRLLHERRTAEQLTGRELQILKQVATGRSNPEIGAALGISEGTVRIHMTSVMHKLDARTRTEAVAAALKRGILRSG